MREEDLRSVLGALGVGGLTAGTNGWLHAPCPLARWTHKQGRDGRPSFAAKVEDDGVSAYGCFTCHHHGRISSLVRALHMWGADVGPMGPHGQPELVTTADAADMGVFAQVPWDRSTAEPEVQPPPEPIDEVAVGDAYDPAWEVPEARAYLERRDVRRYAAGRMGLAWDPDQRRVLFPVRDASGSLYGWSGRTIDERRNPKVRDYAGLPKRHMILGAEHWRGTPGGDWPLVLVEGLFAYARLISFSCINWRCDVGAILGTTFTPEKLATIKARYQATYLLMDDDEAGDASLFGRLERDGTRSGGAIAALRGHVPLFVPPWPEGKHDPDELTAEEFTVMLRDTTEWGT